jgi:hypothetical protein
MLFNKNNNGTQEIAGIATWTANHRYEHIYPALLLAKRKVLKIIDKATYQTALTHYQSDDFQADDPTDEQKRLDNLVYWFRYVLLNFAYSKNLSKDTVLWDNSGINVAWTDNFRPAQQDTLANLGESLDRDGYEFLDLLIEFLNENIDIFTDFKQSVENRKLKQLFVNDAEDFSFYFNIKGSVSYFFEILDVIRRVQRTHIFSALGSLYYNLVQDYQEKRLELEDVTDEVETFAELPATPADGDIVLVASEKTYYKFINPGWIQYAYDSRLLLDMIKPALIDYTIYTKFVSDISNLKGNAKQLEQLQANADFLKSKAQASTAHIIDYLKTLMPVDVDAVVETETAGYSYSNNSFMMQ